MLVSGCLVLTGEQGNYTPVEELKSGETVVNPVSGQRHVIVHTMKREVVYQGSRTTSPLSLRPRSISRNLLDKGVPFRELILSPKQSICLASGGRTTTSLAEIEVLTAAKLLSRHCIPDNGLCGRFTYHAVFTERPQLMDVNGLLLGSTGAREMALNDNYFSEFEQSADEVLEADRTLKVLH